MENDIVNKDVVFFIQSNRENFTCGRMERPTMNAMVKAVLKKPEISCKVSLDGAYSISTNGVYNHIFPYEAMGELKYFINNFKEDFPGLKDLLEPDVSAYWGISLNEH